MEEKEALHVSRWKVSCVSREDSEEEGRIEISEPKEKQKTTKLGKTTKRKMRR